MNDAVRFQTLYTISRALHEHSTDLQRLFQTLIALTGEALAVRHGCLIAFEDYTRIEHVYVLGATDKTGLDFTLWEALLKRGTVGYVYHSDRTVVIRNIQTDPRWIPLPEVTFLPTTGSAISISLGKPGHKYGVLLLAHPDVDYFTKTHVDLLEEIARLASTAVAGALEIQTARTGDRRYYALFEGAVVPIILTDVRGVIQDVNDKACDFLGYPRGALLRIPLTDIHASGKDTFNPAELVASDKQESSVRTTMYDVDGKAIPALVRARKVNLEGKAAIEWVIQDITAQMELEQLRKDLAAMVYHDLRGPLTNIVGSIYKLSSVLQNHENPAVLKLLHIGLRSTRQLQRMVDSLLDIQRLEEGRTILNRQPVEVRVLLTDAVQLVQPIATEAGQRLLFEAGKDIPTIAIDSDMIMRVLINLMENAVKYTPTEGTIRVSVARDHDQVIFKVSDSGPGIPADMLHRVFDKFSRVKYQGAPKGVGLGLAFCRLAVEAHGGKIWVESEPGNGSDFIFRLPLIEPSREDAFTEQEPEPKDEIPEPRPALSAADTHPVRPPNIKRATA